MASKKLRTIVITGGTQGIGFHSALGLATLGARVLITGRNMERGITAAMKIRSLSNNPHITFVDGDLSSIGGVDKLAASIFQQTRSIDVLVNNAGVFGSELVKSDDGIEMHFAVNVFAPWRLTKALLPRLREGDKPRVVNVTGGDKPACIDPDNLQAEKGFKGLMTYTHSKSILEAMSMILAEELKPMGVTVNIVFPGRASTAMTQSLSMKSLPGPMKIMFPFFRLFFRDDGGKSAAAAARSTIWAATNPELDEVTGSYFDMKCKERKLHPSAYNLRVQESIREVIEGVEASRP